MEAVKAGEAAPRFAALVNGISAPAMPSESLENGKTKVRMRFLQQALARRGMDAQCIIALKPMLASDVLWFLIRLGSSMAGKQHGWL